MNKDIIENIIVNNTRKAMLDSIDNIHDIDFLKRELKKHLREEFNLQNQLQEKNKIIDEMLNYGIFDCDCPLGSELGNKKMFDCENCNDNSKKCWLKYFENKIKRRGKNGK